MSTTRLEAFSDGVLAIVITVMVLELKVPDGNHLSDLWHDSALGLLTYVLSFVYVGIYWNNHHHLFQVCDRVDGRVLWANLGLLFTLSLYPFTTAWMDESRLSRTTVVVYGVNLLAAGTAYYVLQHFMARVPGQGLRMREVYGRTGKEIASIVLYVVGIALAFVAPWLALVPYAAVAITWLRPDRRVERYLAARGDAYN
jgi:uncharacterized membrane protein